MARMVFVLTGLLTLAGCSVLRPSLSMVVEAQLGPKELEHLCAKPPVFRLEYRLDDSRQPIRQVAAAREEKDNTVTSSQKK